jgi:integrase
MFPSTSESTTDTDTDTVWAAFSAEILAAYEPPIRAERTYRKLRGVLSDLHRRGVRSPDQLGVQLVTRIARELAASGLRTATVRGNLAYLSMICAYAVAAGHLDRSPFDYRRNWWAGLESEEEEPDRPRHLPAESIARVLHQADAEADAGGWIEARTRTLVYTAALTGLRRDELLRLGWSEVELDSDGRGGFVRLAKRRRRRFKTLKAIQPVPIPPSLAPVLAWWRERCGSAAWVFPAQRRRDRPWVGGNVAGRALGRIQALGRRAGVAGLTFLVLRHSWATHAEAIWRLTEPQIRRVLRHTTDRAARDWYRHADESGLRRAVAAVAYPVLAP